MLDVLHWHEPLWMILAIPFLIFIAPQIIKYLVSILITCRRRTEKLSLQEQISEYRAELSKISQVDEFAKYSKVQRKLRSSSDVLASIQRQDFELNIKYILIARGLSWLIAIIFSFRLIYQLYAIFIYYIGFDKPLVSLEPIRRDIFATFKD